MALFAYSSENNGWVVPSFNLPQQPGSETNYVAGPNVIMNGWPCILDRDGFVPTRVAGRHHGFLLPEYGGHQWDGQRPDGNERGQLRGWIEWPMEFAGPTYGDSDPQIPLTWPAQDQQDHSHQLLESGHDYNPTVAVTPGKNCPHPCDFSLTIMKR